MKLTINSKIIESEIVRVEDYLSEKMCKVVIKITQEEVIDEVPTKSGYEIIEGFFYEETWEDAGVIEFATEKVNKRFS